MPWVAIDTDLEEHPKFHAFLARRGWPPDWGLAFLLRFWRTVRRHAPNGDVTGWTDAYLAKQVSISRGAAGLLDDLVACGFVDEGEGESPGRVVHNWHERNGKHLRENLKPEDRQKGGRARASAAVRNEKGRFSQSGQAGGRVRERAEAHFENRDRYGSASLPDQSRRLLGMLGGALCSPPEIANEVFFHADLEELSTEQLRFEWRWPRLDLTDRPGWLVPERIRRIKAELEARHAR